MANEYKFRASADMSNHDKALQKSANEVRKYKQATEQSKKEVAAFANNVKGKALTGIKSFAGALGVAATAAEMFEKVIRGSQTTSDKWDATVRAATSSANSFFTALSTGDFSTFLLGLDGVISKAKDTAAALDALGNARISYDYFSSKNNAALNQALVIAKDKSKSKAERDNAIKAANDIIAKQKEYTNSKGATVITALQQLVSEKNLLNGATITQSDVDKILELDLLSNSATKKKWQQQEYNFYLAQTKRINNQYSKKDPQRLEALKKVTEQNKLAVLYNELLVKMSDDELKNITALSIEFDSNNRALAEMQNRMLELSNQSVGMREALNGSIAAIDKEIQNLELEYKYTTDSTTRSQLLQEINKLKNDKIILSVVYTPQTHTMAGATPVAATPLPTTLPNVPIATTAKYFDDVTDSANAACSVISTFGGLMSNIGSITEDTKHAWAAYVGAFAQGISQLIPQVMALTTAEQANAVAGGASSAAKLPFPANLAAIASVIATLTSVFAGSFASGGIIKGATSIGDYNLAAVNSGEMILNGSQQSRLFSLLNSGVMHTNTTNGYNEVEFKLRGDQLIGLINNSNKKYGRVA